MRRTALLLPAIVVVVALFLSSIFIVDERQKVLVLQFGQIVRIKEDPGLGFRIPFIQNVVAYDDRILSIETSSLEVTPLDDRRLVVDAFARYRINNVERFREATGAGGDRAIETAGQRLESILYAKTREVLGSVNSNDILSSDREALMLRIRNAAISEANALGLAVIDVRLKRTDLPPENLEQTFRRMVAEREREAEDERARGREEAQVKRAEADRKVVEIVSDANRKAEITRGEADAERNEIFGKAFSQDPEFFEFYRSMRAYERSLTAGSTSLVLTPDNEFFSYLKSDTGAASE